MYQKLCEPIDVVWFGLKLRDSCRASFHTSLTSFVTMELTVTKQLEEKRNISAAAGSTSQTFRVFSVIRFLESKEEFSVVCYIIWWKEQIRIIVEITLGFKISGKTSLNALTSPWKARTNGGWVSDLALSISKLFSLLCRGRNKSLQDFKDTKLQL